MKSANSQHVGKIDWIALIVFAALFVAWYLTGYSWLRYSVLGAMCLYLFVVRIVANHYYSKKEEARLGDEQEQ
ncbi:MAG: hypothetical protein K2F92_04735 [Alistipes sp.]|nr:hypothetical protein [Alistipes sp.]